MPRNFVEFAECVAMSEPANREERPVSSRSASDKPEIKTWSSSQLLGDAHEARIEHGGEVYRLLRTRNDKLILVK